MYILFSGGHYGNGILSTDSGTDGFPFLTVIIAGSAVVGVLLLVMIIFIIRSKHKKTDTPSKKPATTHDQTRSSNYNSVSSERRYEYKAIQAYNSQGPQHELLHPESSISDTSTPHKYASITHSNPTPPPPNMVINMSTEQPMQQQQPIMHLQHNPMMHPHTHMHPAHAGMMAYPGVHIPQDPHGYHTTQTHSVPPPAVDYDMGGYARPPYMGDYNRPPSPPTQHVLYKSC